jgi:hypothetical protein
MPDRQQEVLVEEPACRDRHVPGSTCRDIDNEALDFTELLSVAALYLHAVEFRSTLIEIFRINISESLTRMIHLIPPWCDVYRRDINMALLRSIHAS